MASLARIHIKNLRLRAIVGVYAFERDLPQDLTLNVRFSYEAADAARSDVLDHAVDYHALSNRIVDYVQASRYELLESLCGKVLDLVMDDVRILDSEIAIEKPGAIPEADGVVVTMRAKR